MLDSCLKIGIVGAGIGGLALSISLQKSGYDVTVFERSSRISTYGAGIQLSPNGLKVLRDLGIETKINAAAYSPERIVIINGQTNRLISGITLGGTAADRYEAKFLQIHRSDLIEILYDKAVELGVRFNFGCVAVIKSANNNSAIISTDEYDFKFDVAVGADGVHSTTRGIFFKSAAPKFLNQVAYRTTIPLEQVEQQFCEPEVKIIVGPGRHIVIYPLISRSLLNVVFCQDEPAWSSDGWSVAADISELAQNFGNFKSANILLTNITYLKKWGLFGYENPLNWNSERVVLLGDACHPMLPYLAQGANQALEDAISLGYFLSSKSGVALSHAMIAYTNNRRHRVLRVQQAASRNSTIYHLQRGPTRFLSHSVLTLMSRVAPNFLLSQLDWLYGYNFPR